MSLMDMSLAGGVLILAVTALRAVSIHRLPKGAFLCLWTVALGRLLIPYALPSALSVYTLLERLAPVAEPVGTAVVPSLALPVVPAPYVPGTVVVTAPKAAPAFSIDWPTVIWLAVAVAFAVFFAVSHRRCRREFYTALPVNNDMAEAFYATQPLRRKVRLRVSDRITAPLTYGVARPVILLPKGFDWTDQEGLACALCHELCHIRRFDAVTKLVLAAALCLHWFNPAVWVMYVLANRDLELSCDEAVVRQLGPDRRRVYADALIRMEERRGGVAPLYNHFSKNAMEERIVAIMKLRKTSLAALIMAVTLIIGVTVAFATTAKSPDPAQGTVVDQIIDSLDYQSDRITFTLPKSLDKPEELTIHVAGRAQYEDGFSQSLHFLEGETWQAGKMYTIPYDPSYTDLFLDVSYQLNQRNVDLLAAGKYGPDNPLKSTTEVQHITSYVDPYDGKTYFSTDNGQTWQEGDPFAALGHGLDDVEWWTAEEYEAWMTQQKKELQAMLGERSWNPTEGWYTWDQDRIDKAMEGNERLLEEIRDGKLVSKPTADGDTMIQFSYDPRAIGSTTRVDPMTGQTVTHNGVDIAAPAGTSVYAAHDGKVTTAEFQDKYGNHVVIDRGDGMKSLYAHLSKMTVSVGDRVEAGQVIGAVGSTGQSTGSHLHFALYQDGVLQTAYALPRLLETQDAVGLSQPAPDYTERSQAELLAEYGPYGISFDSAGNMLCEGVVIGLFVDGVELEDGGWALRYVYQSDVGAQSLISVRDRKDNGDGSYDPFGPLTGIRAMTDEELAELGQVGAKTVPSLEAVAVMAKDATAEDNSVDFRDAFNEKFKPYGVSFVPSGTFGNIDWNGQRVSVFEDAAPDGSYQTLRSIDGGEVSLRAVYDAQGKLTGVAQS